MTALHTDDSICRPANKLSIMFPAGVKYSCFIESGSDLSGFCYSDWIIDKNGALFVCNCYQWCFWERSDCICHERSYMQDTCRSKPISIFILSCTFCLAYMTQMIKRWEASNAFLTEFQKNMLRSPRNQFIFLWDSLKWHIISLFQMTLQYSSFVILFFSLIFINILNPMYPTKCQSCW